MGRRARPSCPDRQSRMGRSGHLGLSDSSGSSVSLVQFESLGPSESSGSSESLDPFESSNLSKSLGPSESSVLSLLSVSLNRQACPSRRPRPTCPSCWARLANPARRTRLGRQNV